MAETGKKTAPHASETPANPGPEVPGKTTENQVTATTNETEESPRASHRVKVVFPHSSFSMEDVPTITADGTMLTKPQLAKAEKLAPEYGVELEVEDV